MAGASAYSILNPYNSVTRFVCISDTHNHYDFELPTGDILLHSGDFTNKGTEEEIETFLNWLKSLHQYRLKIFICGNHESKRFYTKKSHRKLRIVEQIKTDPSLRSDYGIVYLQDQAFQDPRTGWKFYGSGWLSEYSKHPEQTDTDILLTHGPPYSIFDQAHRLPHIGSKELLIAVTNIVQPILHLFGHAHSGYEQLKDEEHFGRTLFINAALCNSRFHRVRSPIIIDLQKSKSSSAQ